MTSDPRQLPIPHSESAALSPRWQEYRDALERARERVLNPHAPNTKRAYEAAWAAWEAHCAEYHRPPLPIEPDALVAYLELCSSTKKPNTVRLHLAALCAYDQAARVSPVDKNPLSLRASPIVKRWLRSWGRENPSAPHKQAPPLSPAELHRILDVAREPASRASRHSHAARYCRDRAMILLGVGAALRVSELVALDVADVVRGDRGLTVHVRRSKTDQHGVGRIAGVMPQGRSLLCPIDAWLCWLAFRGTHEGPAFCEIDRQGTSGERLTTRGAEHAIQARAKRVGLSLVSSHSLRASLATRAAEKSKPVHEIMKQGGWKSANTVARYIRQGELFNGQNPTAGLLDDD